jgi:arylsulfatase A-like enzyme
MLDRTALLVMSDHGREKTGRDHGGFTTAELAVQWLLTGPAVRKGVRLSSPISIMDTMPTLLHAVGVPPPVQFYGRPVREACAPPRASNARGPSRRTRSTRPHRPAPGASRRPPPIERRSRP